MFSQFILVFFIFAFLIRVLNLIFDKYDKENKK